MPIVNRPSKWLFIAALSVSAVAVAANAQSEPSAGTSEPNISVVSRQYDIPQIVAAESIPENVRRGRALWLQRCAYCHDGVGQPGYNTLGPWISPEVISGLGDEGLRQFINQGTERMPGYRYALSPAEMADLLAHMKTVTMTEKPTEAQLAGKLPGEQGSD